MPKIDVIDEAIIDASPTVVYKAILNEYAGVTNWFMPILEYKLRTGIPIDREGAIVDITINPKGRMKGKVTEKMTKLVEAESIEEEVAGDFVRTREWTFEPTEGKTKVKCRFNVKTNNLCCLLSLPSATSVKYIQTRCRKDTKH